MRAVTCDEMRANAAEMALGILSGDERADALDHMEHCVACRTLVEGLAQTSDSILLLAPEADPPIGFESAVASRVADSAPIGPEPSVTGRAHSGALSASDQEMEEAPAWGAARPAAKRARSPRLRAALAVAAATVLVGTTAGTVTLIDHSSLGGGGESQTAEAVLQSGQFKGADGRPVGQVLASAGYNGGPSWVLMNVDASGANGAYTCELVLSNGNTVPVGQFMVQDGIGEWAHTVSVDVKSIKAAKLVGPSGATLATASIS